MIAGRRLTVALWVPLFAVLLVTAVLNGFQDIWLFAIALGLATWSVSDAAVLLGHHLQQWHRTRRPAGPNSRL